MNKRLVLRLLGKLLLLEAALMLPSLALSLYDRQDPRPFLYTILLLLFFGLLSQRFHRQGRPELRAMDGFAAVGLSWVVLSLFGALPFVFSGITPSWIDALFEAVSGFTTTAASVLTDLEVLPRSILLWRSGMIWVGGMGVLVLTLALMPTAAGRGTLLVRAESPGPVYNKMMPMIANTSRVLYAAYAAATLVLILLLRLSGVGLFDSIIHAFGTAGTGGFSNYNRSVAALNNPMAEVLIAVFMLFFGTNFFVVFHLVRGEGMRALRNEELRAYLLVALGAWAVMTLSNMGRHEGFLPTLRHAGFQISSILSTTGYATDNFDLWPQFSRVLLLMLMLVGASAGSTSSGIKVVRAVLVGKILGREVRRTLHPRRVEVIRLDGKPVAEEVLHQVTLFVFVYFALLFAGALVASLDGHDFITCFSASAASLSNVGAGLSAVGPHGNYSGFSDPVKLVFSFLMLAGRLEFFPLLGLFAPSLWRKG